MAQDHARDLLTSIFLLAENVKQKIIVIVETATTAINNVLGDEAPRVAEHNNIVKLVERKMQDVCGEVDTITKRLHLLEECINKAERMPQGVSQHVANIMHHSSFSRSDDHDITNEFINKGVLGPIFSFNALEQLEELRRFGKGGHWMCLIGWLQRVPGSIDEHGKCQLCSGHCVAFTVHGEEESDANKLEFRFTAQ
jgi:hypothetical protein